MKKDTGKTILIMGLIFLGTLFTLLIIGKTIQTIMNSCDATDEMGNMKYPTRTAED